MGQAKQRGTFEDRLKQAVPRAMHLIMAQYHYRSDSDDGVLFCLMPETPQNLKDTFSESVSMAVQGMKREIDQDDYSHFTGVSRSDQALDWYIGQLKHTIPIFNQLVWGQPTHPAGQSRMQQNWSNEKFVESAVIIATNITLLTIFKKIPNDHFNGASFMHITETQQETA